VTDDDVKNEETEKEQQRSRCSRIK